MRLSAFLTVRPSPLVMDADKWDPVPQCCVRFVGLADFKWVPVLGSLLGRVTGNTVCSPSL